LVSVQPCAARVQTDSLSVDERLAAASRSIIDGHVKDGFDGLELLLVPQNYIRIPETVLIHCETLKPFAIL